MGTLELKLNIHRIVDEIQNEELLKAVYDFLRVSENAVPGRLWSTLTEEQKQEVFLAYDESEDENNLIEREKVFQLQK